jgi:small subunit ribosomal protein S5
MARGRFNQGYNEEPKEFEEKVVQVHRVSKKTKGGNRMGFSVVVVIGDRKGRVGVGLGKAADVQSSIQKAVSYAKKHLVTVPLVNATIPHEINVKVGAARLMLKPASPGTGVIAGGAVRAVVEAAGIKDILSKVLGTSNQASNVYAALEALRQLRTIPANKMESQEKATPIKETPNVGTNKETKTKTAIRSKKQ